MLIIRHDHLHTRKRLGFLSAGVAATSSAYPRRGWRATVVCLQRGVGLVVMVRRGVWVSRRETAWDCTRPMPAPDIGSLLKALEVVAMGGQLAISAEREFVSMQVR